MLSLQNGLEEENLLETPAQVPSVEVEDHNDTETHISAIMSDLDLEDCDVELRSITDVTDTDYDHIAQIHSLLAVAKDKSKNTQRIGQAEEKIRF